MAEKIEIDPGNIQNVIAALGRATDFRKKHPLLVAQSAVKIMEQLEYDFPSGAYYNGHASSAFYEDRPFMIWILENAR